MSSETTDPPVYLASPDPAIRSAQGASMGSVTSERKRQAVRINGRMGGRPVQLGLLGLKGDPLGPRILVSWSRSWGGIVFTYPDGQRHTYDRCRCANEATARVLCDEWWKRDKHLQWFPFWPKGVNPSKPRRKRRPEE